MVTKRKLVTVLVLLLANLLVACDAQQRFIAPEIEPPVDLIPSYVPEGFELKSGFQLPGELTHLDFSGDENSDLRDRLLGGGLFLDTKSPSGNDIQGVYYQSKEYLILITKSYFPESTMDDWMAKYNDSQPSSCDCECVSLQRWNAIPLLSRFVELQGERTINGTRVAILKGPLGWNTIFVRGDYLLTVESGISLEENLKIVESLLEN